MESQEPNVDTIYKMQEMDSIMSKLPGSFKSGGYLKNYLKSFELWKYLSNDSTLQEHGIIFESPPKGNCFVIQFPINCSFTESISIIMSRGDSLFGVSEYFEIAFYNNDGSLSAVHEDLFCEDDVYEKIVSILKNGVRCYVETDY